MALSLVSFRTNSRLKRAFNVVEVGFVVTDLNPIISEPIRFGTLFGAQGIFHNVLVSAVAFGAITLLLDALGAVATADLLAKSLTTKLIDKTNEVVRRVGLGRLADVRTSLDIDLLVTLIVGTPFTLMLKQRQNPKRTRDDNLRLGLLLSVVASFVSALQGGAIVAGLWHPDALNVSLAAVAILSLLGIQRWLRKRFGQSSI